MGDAVQCSIPEYLYLYDAILDIEYHCDVVKSLLRTSPQDRVCLALRRYIIPAAPHDTAVGEPLKPPSVEKICSLIEEISPSLREVQISGHLFVSSRKASDRSNDTEENAQLAVWKSLATCQKLESIVFPPMVPRDTAGKDLLSATIQSAMYGKIHLTNLKITVGDMGYECPFLVAIFYQCLQILGTQATAYQLNGDLGATVFLEGDRSKLQFPCVRRLLAGSTMKRRSPNDILRIFPKLDTVECYCYSYSFKPSWVLRFIRVFLEQNRPSVFNCQFCGRDGVVALKCMIKETFPSCICTTSAANDACLIRLEQLKIYLYAKFSKN